MIGQRLKLARAAAGLSLRDLEAKIGNLVTAQAIGKYERNESMPGSKVLIALAGSLDVSPDYLLGEQEMALDGVEFRKKAITSKREEAKVEAKVLHLCERYLALEELLGVSSDWDKPRDAPFPVMKDYIEADRAANQLRQHWTLGNDPIPNLVELIESSGIKVLSIDDEKIDGITARVHRKDKPDVPVIVINSGDWSERKRFNLAHELGHLVMDVATNLDAERAAMRFAGAFLMPAEAMWREVGKHRTDISIAELVRLKKLFGVSLQGITYRCKDLGIISDSLFRRLFDRFEKEGWRRSPYKELEAIPASVEEPNRLPGLCFRAVAEHAISESKAAEILGVSTRALIERMEKPAKSPL